MSTSAAEGRSFVTGGFQEAVFSVSDLAQHTAFYESVAGWSVLHRGEIPQNLRDAYRLPSAAAGREVVLGNPGTTRGFLRLLEFSGVEQRQIRSNAQPWDTGGFFDVNCRVLDMDLKFRQMQARGWQAVSDPVTYAFGPFVVAEWLARGPDGIVVALIERIEPPLTGWPHLREFSRLFNATQIVSDARAAVDFYVEKLGFRLYLEHVDSNERPEQNLLGLPHNVAVDVPREVYILHPDGTNEGSIEVLAFDGATGRDFSRRAVPPHLGILTLRFPVTDIAAFAEDLRSKAVDLQFAPRRTSMPPYGDVHLLGLRGPGGAWLEFFETV